MNFVFVYNYFKFNTLCRTNGWNDSNIPTDKAFISICCTDECKRGYILARDPDAEDEHWFKEDHDNVINLNFDDIIDDEMTSTTNEGTFIYKCISEEDTAKLARFIEKNRGKDFIIHCRAGKSRSQGVARYIYDTYQEYQNGRPENPCLYPNVNVVAKLKRCYNGVENE